MTQNHLLRSSQLLILLFPLQELWGVKAVDACLHCRDLPQKAIYRNFYGGLTKAQLQGRYFSSSSQRDVTRDSSLYNLKAFPIGVLNMMSRYYYVNAGLLML